MRRALLGAAAVMAFPLHSNTVEAYFSIFKRGMRGVYASATG